MEVCEVSADGDCFYHCVVQCTRGHGCCLDTTVAMLRAGIAQYVREDARVREWIRLLVKLYKDDTATLKQENPLLKNVRSLQDISDNITVKGVWASQIEVGVTQLMLATHQMSLVVVEANCASAADQLLAALDKATLPWAMVLVRVEDCHYRFLQLSRSSSDTRAEPIRIFDTAWLLYHAACLVMLEDSDDQLF